MKVFSPVDVLKQYMQGPALQNEVPTVHVMLKGERLSPAVGLMVQDGGEETSCRVLEVVVG